MYVFILLLNLMVEDVPFPVLFQGSSAVNSSDSALQGLAWYKWQTKNFVVLSIDEKQGLYLANHLEEIKQILLEKWGIADFNFKTECRLICMPNQELMKKLFNGLDYSKIEARKKFGKNDLLAGWLLLDNSPAKTVTSPLMEMCLEESCVNFCLIKGMAGLSSPVEVIRKNLIELAENKRIYFAKSLLTMTRDKWELLSIKDRNLFNSESIVFCLMLRREFGQDKFLKFLQLSNNPELALKKVYLFNSYNEFNISFVNYLRDLCLEVRKGKTPDKYLEIRPK